MIATTQTRTRQGHHQPNTPFTPSSLFRLTTARAAHGPHHPIPEHLIDAHVFAGRDLLEGPVHERHQVQAAVIAGQGAQVVLLRRVVDIRPTPAQEGDLGSNLPHLLRRHGVELLQGDGCMASKTKVVSIDHRVRLI